MSSEEVTVWCYSDSLVAMELMKCFLKQDSIKARHFVECLSHLAVDVEQSVSWTTLKCGLRQEVCLRCVMQLFKAVEKRP